MNENPQVIIEFVPDASKLDASLQNTMTELQATGKIGAEVAAQFSSAQNGVTESINKTNQATQNLGDSYKQINANIAGGALKEAGAQMNDFATSTGRVTTQVRAMTNELTKMRLAGLQGTEAFEKLQNQTAQLSRQAIVSRGTVHALAEEFQGFKAAAEAIHGVNAAMQIGTGVAATFGTENEKVQKEIQSLVGVMLIANGLQEAANLLKETSILRLKAEAAWTGVLTTATEIFGETAEASMALATGGVTLLIGLVVGLIAAYESVTGKAKEYRDELEKQNDDILKQQEILKLTISLWNKFGIDTYEQQRKLLVSEYVNAVNTADKLAKLGEDMTDKQKEEFKKQEQIASDKNNELLILEKEHIDKIQALNSEAIKRDIENKQKGFQQKVELFDNETALQRDALLKQITADKDQSDKRYDLAEFDERRLQERKELYRKENLKNEAFAIQAKLDLIKKGSIEEDNLRKELASNKAKGVLTDPDASTDAKKEAAAKSQEEISKINEEALKRNLQTNINNAKAELALTEQNSVERLAAEKKVLLAESQLKLEDAKGNTSKQLEVENEYYEQSKELDDKYTKYIQEQSKKRWDASKKNAKEAADEEYKSRAGLDDIELKDSKKTNSEKLKLQIDKLEAERAKNLEYYLSGNEDYLTFVNTNKAIDAKEKELKRAALEAEIKDDAKIAIDTAKKVSDSVFAIEKENRDQIYKLKLDAIQRTSDFELNNDRLTGAQKAAIKKKFDKEAAAIKLQQWKADKEAREEQAVINTALAVVNALATAPTIIAGVALAAAAAAAGAAEIATIASTKPPAFALGTPKGSPSTPAGMKLVGEHGPELITTGGGERIVPSAETAKILADYAIPAMPSFDGSGIALSELNQNAGIDYDKLGNVIAEKLKGVTQAHISIDKNGIHTMIVKGGSKHTFNNNKFSA